METREITAYEYAKNIAKLIEQGDNTLKTEIIPKIHNGNRIYELAIETDDWGVIIDTSMPYKDKADAYTVALDIIKFIDQHQKNHSQTINKITGLLDDFDTVKNNIDIALVNSQEHDLSNCLHINLCEDVDAVLRIRFAEINPPCAVTITKDLIKEKYKNIKGLNTKNLFKIAQENMCKDIEVQKISDIYMKAAKEVGAFIPPDYLILMKNNPWLCVTNTSTARGAGYLFANNIGEKLREICPEFYGDGKYLAIPSSVHEIILVPEKVFLDNPEQYRNVDEIIRSINGNPKTIPTKDKLSDTPFLFDANEKTLTLFEDYLKDKEEQKEM